jgi:hypothetical protein
MNSLRAIAAVLLLAAAPTAQDQILEGKLPDDPARPLVESKCLLCHTGEYVTQQRLTEGQWQKTVEKMRKFGSPLSDEEVKTMVAYLSRYWTQDLPLQRPVRAGLPSGPK